MIERLNVVDVYVWLVKDVLLLLFKVLVWLVWLSLSGEDVGCVCFFFVEYVVCVVYVNVLFDVLVEGNLWVSVFDFFSVFCDGLDCFVECDGWLLYMDNNYFLIQGVYEFGFLFELMLQSFDDLRIVSQQ